MNFDFPIPWPEGQSRAPCSEVGTHAHRIVVFVSGAACGRAVRVGCSTKGT